MRMELATFFFGTTPNSEAKFRTEKLSYPNTIFERTLPSISATKLTLTKLVIQKNEKNVINRNFIHKFHKNKIPQ